jgi:neutral ceramidase
MIRAVGVTVVLLAVFGIVVQASPSVAADQSAAMKAGFAEADITPQIGMEQPGGYGKSYHQTLHDPCKVRAAVFDDGQRRVAVMGVDALAIGRSLVEKARRQIIEKTGIPAGSILISASHSHSSGPLFGTRPEEYADAPSLIQKLACDNSTTVNPEYETLVERQLVAAACQADSARAEVRAGAGKGIEDRVAFNRRFRMKNGLSYTHPGVGNRTSWRRPVPRTLRWA